MEYNSIAKFLLYAANENGVSWMFKRSLYELKRKYKWHNYKFNKRDWNNNEFNKWVIPEVSNNPNDYFKIWKKNRPMFFFQPKKRLQYARSIKGLLNKSELKKIITKAEKIKNGEFQYFSSQNYKINFPPDWHLNPICEKRINSNC